MVILAVSTGLGLQLQLCGRVLGVCLGYQEHFGYKLLFIAWHGKEGLSYPFGENWVRFPQPHSGAAPFACV